MSDISEANAKIARQEHIKTQQERINQLERELEETTAALEKQLQNYSEIVTENESLRNWKTEQLAVEAEWNPQTIGWMLGMLPGVSIRKNIESCIAQLQAENERLREENEAVLQGAMKMDANFRKLNEMYPQAIIKTKQDTAREIVEFLDVCCMSRSAEMIAERFGLEG